MGVCTYFLELHNSAQNSALDSKDVEFSDRSWVKTEVLKISHTSKIFLSTNLNPDVMQQLQAAVSTKEELCQNSYLGLNEETVTGLQMKLQAMKRLDAA